MSIIITPSRPWATSPIYKTGLCFRPSLPNDENSLFCMIRVSELLATSVQLRLSFKWSLTVTSAPRGWANQDMICVYVRRCGIAASRRRHRLSRLHTRDFTDEWGSVLDGSTQGIQLDCSPSSPTHVLKHLHSACWTRATLSAGGSNISYSWWSFFVSFSSAHYLYHHPKD